MREKKGGRESKREIIDWLFCLVTHSLADSFMCPDQRSKPQPLVYQDGTLTN